MIRFLALAAALAVATPALAQEGRFAEGSQAESWGLFGEELAKFDGRVVDALCVLTGDCPADCGAGKRQMGVLRTADNAFVFATKNGEPVFTGANVDLAAYCNQTVTIHGLLVGDSSFTPKLGAKLFQVQLVQPVGAVEPVPAGKWVADWQRRTGLPEAEEPWFMRDPAVQAEIEANGYLGLGKEVDDAYRKQAFP